MKLIWIKLSKGFLRTRCKFIANVPVPALQLVLPMRDIYKSPTLNP